MKKDKQLIILVNDLWNLCFVSKCRKNEIKKYISSYTRRGNLTFHSLLSFSCPKRPKTLSIIFVSLYLSLFLNFSQLHEAQNTPSWWIIHRGSKNYSVIRYWNKMLLNFVLKMPKNDCGIFYFKSDVLKLSTKSPNIWANFER